MLHDARLRLIIGLYGAQTLAAGALNVLIVVMALQVLDLGKSGIGFLNSAVGIGGLIGGLAAFTLIGRPRLASAFGLGLALVGLPLAVLALVPHTAPALLLLGIVGLGTTIVDVAGLTLLQRAVPDEVLTRVMGVVQSVFVGTLGLGAVLAPVLIIGLGTRGALAATGISSRPWLSSPGDRCAGSTRRLHELPKTWSCCGRSRSSGRFRRRRSSSSPTSSILCTLPPGRQIIGQGEHGDRFYVVAAGEVEVQVDGQPSGTLHAGDYFGEIALLRDVPRTATVTALTDMDLLALDRDEFISAVTGHPESAEAAHAAIANRLASHAAGRRLGLSRLRP